MKLYTEEQVNKIALQVKDNGYWNNLEISPIELPSDEEIENKAKDYADSIGNKNGTAIFDYIKGAKWMKSQIVTSNT